MSNHRLRKRPCDLAAVLAGITLMMLFALVVTSENLSAEGFGLLIGMSIAGLYWLVDDRHADSRLILMLSVGLFSAFLGACGMLGEEFDPKPDPMPYWVFCGFSQGLMLALPLLATMAVQSKKRAPLQGFAKFLTYFVLEFLLLLTALRLCCFL